MRRPPIFVGGALLVVAGIVLGLRDEAAVLNTGVRYGLTTVSIVIGILVMLAGVQKDDGPAFDPDARITEHAWSNDEQAWTIGEALGMSLWAFWKAKSGVILLSLPVVLVSLVGAVVGWQTFDRVALHLPLGIRNPASIAPAYGMAIAWLLTSVAGFFVMPGLAKLCLAALRSSTVTVSQASPFLRFLPRLLGFGLVYTVLLVVTAPLLTLPAVPFLLTPFFIIDKDLSIPAAMRQSWRASRHHFGKLWLYQVAFLPLMFVGHAMVLGGELNKPFFVACLAYAVVAQPLYMAGLAYAYTRITGTIGMPYFPPEEGSRFIRRFLRLSLLALTAVFVRLVYTVENLPTMQCSTWNIHDALLRASAIVTGVFVIIVLMALILPYMLDQLEGRRFTAFVAARHVRSQKSGFLTVISILSICGVAISSCALSSVVSVMGGFSQDLKRKILGNNAHIVVDTTPGTPFGDYDVALERIRKIPGVVGATPVVHGEVMASSASNLAGVIVTGIEPSSIESVIELTHNIEVGKLDYLLHPEKLTKLPPQEVVGIGPGCERYFKGADLPGLADDLDPAVRAVILNHAERPGVILGRELAKTLHVYIGDEVTLVSPLGDLGPMGVMPRTKKFRVAAIFYSGMYEYDATYVYTMMDVAQDYFQTAGKISAIEVKVEDAERADRITPLVVAAVGREDLRVRDWRDINRNLFSALKLERIATFIILSVAIMVASFCIVCTLLLMVTEKGKEIAILKAIGASDGAILRTFIIEGMVIGGIGTVFGVVTGLAVCTGLSWFGLRLDPEVYYIDRLPISVNTADFLAVALAALTICTLSTLYPAYAASRLRPVDGLRDA
ncbi:MAG: Lipoprotein releasing system transrane protein LolC [Myxococcaceae bacterium]|nr:Lipoprotein releasing system transrane protein LolC [Myxococcaceae bacterium]